jgi:hypothetical protein
VLVDVGGLSALWRPGGLTAAATVWLTAGLGTAAAQGYPCSPRARPPGTSWSVQHIDGARETVSDDGAGSRSSPCGRPAGRGNLADLAGELPEGEAFGALEE